MKNKKSMIIVGAITLALFVLTGLSVFAWTRAWWKTCPAVLFWAVFVLVNAAMPASYYIKNSRARSILHIVGEAVTPLNITLIPLVLLADIVWLFTKLSAGLLGTIVLVLFLALCVYGFINAMDIKTKEYDVALDSAHGNTSFVLISDLHLGAFTDRKMIKRMLPDIRKCDPEFVILAGDIFDGAMSELKHSKDILKDLKKLTSSCRVYACEGNHDNLDPDSAGAREAFISEAGITLVKDDCVSLDCADIIFRADAYNPERASAEQLLEGKGADKPVIVVDHIPTETVKLWNAGADLVLSGHYHNGQTFPLNYIRRLFTEFFYGHTEQKGHHSIVTGGVGTYGAPVRVLANNEVVRIDLRNAAAPSEAPAAEAAEE